MADIGLRGDTETMKYLGNHCEVNHPEKDQSGAQFGTYKKGVSDTDFESQSSNCTQCFKEWSDQQQVSYIQNLLVHMNQIQHGLIHQHLQPLLQRDFISALPARGLHQIAENILSYLDANSLAQAEVVCKEWQRVIAEGMLWRKLIERNVRMYPLWNGLAIRKGWLRSLFKQNNSDSLLSHQYYRTLYPNIIKDIKNLDHNWKRGNYTMSKINCRSEQSKGVYCLQYDDEKIVSGLRDNTIKVWNRRTLECVKTLQGHTGSVLCLQYDDQVIITGSSDSTVRVWDVYTGEMVNTLIHHCEAVLHLRFDDGMMVTCSKDRSIAVWDMVNPSEINIRRVLVGHRAAVNVVDFDQRYIVSASGDRTIKVWNTSSCEFVRTLNGHKRGIACLQYRDNLVVSGSSDNDIRLWDIESGTCIRMLDGHEELVRCIRFDNYRIVSGAYDGKIKVWDLKAALDPRVPVAELCLQTLERHQGRVFRLQFDEFQIVSSSHDDSIIIWDFLDGSNNNGEQNELPPVPTTPGPQGMELDPGVGMNQQPSPLLPMVLPGVGDLIAAAAGAGGAAAAAAAAGGGETSRPPRPASHSGSISPPLSPNPDLDHPAPNLPGPS